MPFFSVVIPLYNKEDFIKETLTSVLNQTFKDFEIIIVNDGSTDKSLKLVREITMDYKNIFIVNQKNKGLSTTRNKGISIANGEVIALLDADDIWHQKFLNEIYNLHNTFPEASLYGTDYYERFSTKSILEPKKNIDEKLKFKSFLIDDFFKANFFQPIISQSNFAFKKNIFDSIKFDENIDYAEDIEFYIATCIKYKFAYSYNALATVRLNIPNQMTSLGFKGKRLPSFEKYEKEANSNLSLKTFLNYYCYFFLIISRLNKDNVNYKLMIKNLDIETLTFKQKFLLKCPLLLLKIIRYIKKLFLRYNIRLTSFK